MMTKPTFRIWVGWVLVVGIASVVNLGLYTLKSVSDNNRQGVVFVSQIRVQANRLSALEWQAIGSQSTNPHLLREVADARDQFNQVNAQLTRLGLAGEMVQQIRTTWETYNAWMDEEWLLIEAGNVSQAKSVDTESVDPTFAELNTQLNNLEMVYLAQAEQASATDNAGSALLILGTILLVGLLVRKNQRNVAASQVLRAEQRTLQQSNEQLQRLNETNDMLQNCHAVDEVYRVVASAVQRIFPGMDGALYVRNTSPNSFDRVVGWNNWVEADQRSIQTDQCLALREGRLHVVETGLPDLRCRHLSHPYPSTYMCVPLMTAGQIQGMFYLQPEVKKLNGASISRTDGLDSPVFDQAKQQLVQVFADRVALTLTNLNLLESLYHQSVRDYLTGVFNRRYLEETLERELLRVERTGHELGIILLDIDHFKKINDQFGHAAGDIYLQELGSLLKRQMRRGDIVCRYGGEEFVVVMPDASLENARQRAETLRSAVKELRVRYRDHHVESVTISLGIGAAPQHGTTPKELFQAVDAALYRAKQAGRDRVELS
ncbi:MAG: diguanylate cyclase [Chloroflexi bacterium]|nr:diguanylate cyclase [Chloroflexota bacterium]